MQNFYFELLTLFCSLDIVLNINTTLFPDCVMVALQILVLTVGVRILLGELKLTRKVSFFYRLQSGLFEYRFSSPPSQGGETGSTPVEAKKSSIVFRVWPRDKILGYFFVEPRSER